MVLRSGWRILGWPRGSQSGERARRKFSSTGERAPGYQLSQSYFQNFKRMPAPGWAQKVLCIIVPNRRTASPEFSWVRTRLLSIMLPHLPSSFTKLVRARETFIFYFPNYRTTDGLKKRLGCYQQEQFNLPREYSVFDSSQCIVNNKKIKMRRRRESQISNTLTRQNNNFQGHPTAIFGKISVRKMIWDLEFSEHLL